ncbi:XdhC family protein [Acuticoccus yangtzensis]|uniref:XdhC family protein n=1 Tax=Acuticoccus yangtzensis TaxID=1443441 RepID=UPI0009499486|nr:XdhC family protein [Acuticoccus yangtzensis]ORE93005.1 xanthine dehydrogenase accessory factor [Stappia sp. 22II-S9-Z10]
MKLSDLKAVNAARTERRLCAVITPLDGSEGRVVFAADAASDPLAGVLARRFASGTSGREAEAGVFVRIHRPSPRLVVIGAVHVTQALAPMAEAVGFEVTIIDPRGAFATEERFGAFDFHAEWPDDALMKLDAETAVVTLTHDPKIDDIALLAAMKADCFYIGALGSRKTHAKRIDRMTAAGVSEADMSRIHAPIGLAIGAASPPEIAVSVLAEVIAALRGAETKAAAPERRAA